MATAFKRQSSFGYNYIILHGSFSFLSLSYTRYHLHNHITRWKILISNAILLALVVAISSEHASTRSEREMDVMLNKNEWLRRKGRGGGKEGENGIGFQRARRIKNRMHVRLWWKYVAKLLIVCLIKLVSACLGEIIDFDMGFSPLLPLLCTGNECICVCWDAQCWSQRVDLAQLAGSYHAHTRCRPAIYRPNS